MAKSTVRGIHSILSGAFETAMRWEWTDRNPARPPTPSRQTILATSLEAVAKVIAGTRARSAAQGLYLWLVMVTGVRRGELCGPQIRDVEADLVAVDRAIEQEHQAAFTADKPWPAERKPQPEPASEPEPAAGPPRATEPGNWSELPVSSPEAASDYEPDGQAARLDEILAQVSEAAKRVAAENAGREARAEYAVRVEREAQAEPELALQAGKPGRGRDGVVSHVVVLRAMTVCADRAVIRT